MYGSDIWLGDYGDLWVCFCVLHARLVHQHDRLTMETFGHSLFQQSHTLKSLCSKVYFSFTWHLESPYTDLLQFKHKCTYLFASSLKNKQYTGRSNHEKTWLLIHSVQKLGTPLFYGQLLIWPRPLFILFSNLPIFDNIYLEILPKWTTG